MKLKMTLTQITGLVLAFAGAFEMFVFIYEVRGTLLLRRDKWDCVMGSVESYRLDHAGGVKCSGWSLSCRYSYHYQGVAYESDCVSIAGKSNNETLDAYRRITAKGTVPVWVNARRPSLSVLVKPEMHSYKTSILLGLTSMGTIMCSIFLLSGATEMSKVRQGPTLTIDSRGVVKILGKERA